MVLSALKNANLLLMFLLELCVLAALVYWGFVTGPGTFARFCLGLGAPVLAIIVWALFGAPTGKWHLYGISRVLLKVIFFGSAAVALFVVGQHVLGVLFALIFILNAVLSAAWAQDPQPASA